MAQTEVLLLEPVDGLGGEGDCVKVRAGFARNFLLPRKMALPVNRANQKYIDSLKKTREEREARELEAAKALEERLSQVHLGIAVKTGDGGKMFGSVTTRHIADRLAEDGIEIERRRIHLGHPIKELGRHEFKVKLHNQVSVEMAVEVVSENPIETNEEEQPAEEAATAAAES